MNALAHQVDQTLRSVDKATAIRLERLVRDALELVNRASAPAEKRNDPQRDNWLRRLDAMRNSVGTNKQATSTEEILEDLRSDRF
jgi:hypothetical protein